jgi:polysaccharide export outer membrane protein
VSSNGAASRTRVGAGAGARSRLASAVVRVVLGFALALLLGGAAACSPAPSKYPYAGELDPRRAPYVIGVADQLSISVWGNADVGTNAIVRPDGTVTLALIGDIPAAGRTTQQLEGEIAARLRTYIKGDTLSVTVAVTRTAYYVVVSGYAEKPGIYESQRCLRVSEVVAMAGGANRFASPNETIVIRIAPDGTVRRIPIQLEEVLAGRRLEQDIVLLAGDRIYIP